MARRRRLVTLLSAAFAALLFSLWVSGVPGRLTAEVWPNAAPGDGIVTSCGGSVDNTAPASSDLALADGAAQGAGDQTIGCSNDNSLPQRSEIWPNGVQDGNAAADNGIPGMLTSGF